MSDINLEGLTEQEKAAVLKILGEYSQSGTSATLKEYEWADWEEIPVDIVTFLHDRRYLGNGLYDADGRFTVFPYWEEKLKDIFPDNKTTAYNTLVFTGAIGLGKSTIAVICLLYLLYRLLCLKDPYLYYGMQPIDKISISFINITLDAAKGVALDKMNQMILSSDWFMAHGEMRGETNLQYIPEKHIEVITGSSNNQIIGRALFGNFCLEGDTLIKTEAGDIEISKLVDKQVKVYTLDKDGKVSLSDTCTAKQTAIVDRLIEIELEDGTVIRCTPEHRLMLIDGTYKMAKDLTETDELMGSQELATLGD